MSDPRTLPERPASQPGHSVEFSLLVALLVPFCLVLELVRPATGAVGTGRSGLVGGALDRARASAAIAFVLPG